MIVICSLCKESMNVGFGYDIKMTCNKCGNNIFSFQQEVVEVSKEKEEVLTEELEEKTESKKRGFRKVR